MSATTMPYSCLAAIFVDINSDGKPDLAVGNDSEPNYLHINKGEGTFDGQSYASGFALIKGGAGDCLNRHLAAIEFPILTETFL